MRTRDGVAALAAIAVGVTMIAKGRAQVAWDAIMTPAFTRSIEPVCRNMPEGDGCNSCSCCAQESRRASW